MGVLCTQKCGVEALLAECQSVPPAGLWSVCMQTLLNTQECGMVRGKVRVLNVDCLIRVFC